MYLRRYLRPGKPALRRGWIPRGCAGSAEAAEGASGQVSGWEFCGDVSLGVWGGTERGEEEEVRVWMSRCAPVFLLPLFFPKSKDGMQRDGSESGYCFYILIIATRCGSCTLVLGSRVYIGLLKDAALRDVHFTR